ncbi:MAG: site-2 protease family protein [Spirochaetaceae bacterium]|jgi:regulator of sigma E protease|nr:site-2 protease family protein [Spirochaetaceae bacterium]
MLFVKIILGLIGLGVVVFVHETGHFLAARLMGIDVEAFSIGWGKAILKKKIRNVEYRIGLFPIGGYCKMRGENEFQKAYENREQSIAPVKGTFYGASPWRRIVVSFGGPFFNLVFAVLVLSVIWGIGFEVNTLDNRVVLASEINPGERYPADEAGIATGDRIIAINGQAIRNYHDIQEAITPNPEKNLALTVLRGEERIDLVVRPSLDRASGAGRIGVYFWTDPVISAVAGGSPAAIAGLQPGDRILRVNGEDFPYSVALFRIIRDQPSVLSLDFERNGEPRKTDLIVSYTGEGAADIGIGYKTIQYRTPSYSPPAALVKGARETWKTFVLSLRSLALLFRGIDLTQAVSGPVRITYMVGDAAAEGFGQSFGAGLGSMAGFLSLISIALCIMNLLPLPVLDGGMILLFIVEIIKGHPLNPKAIYAFQTVGVVLIFGLMLFAVFGDILFLVRR